MNDIINHARKARAFIRTKGKGMNSADTAAMIKALDSMSRDRLMQRYGLTEENGKYTALAYAPKLLHDSWTCATYAIAQPNTDDLDDQGDYTASLVDQLTYMHDLLMNTDGDEPYITIGLLDLLNRSQEDLPNAERTEYSFTYGYADHFTPISALAHMND